MVYPRVTRKILLGDDADIDDIFEVRVSCPHSDSTAGEEIYQRRGQATSAMKELVDQQYENTMRRRAEELSCDCAFDVPAWQRVPWP